jgi:hypothetical protein
MELVFGVRGEAVMNTASVMQRTRCTFSRGRRDAGPGLTTGATKVNTIRNYRRRCRERKYQILNANSMVPWACARCRVFANVFSELASAALGYKRSCIERYLMMVNLLHRPVAHLRPSTPRAPPASSYHTSRDFTAPHNTDTPTPSAPNGPALGF